MFSSKVFGGAMVHAALILGVAVAVAPSPVIAQDVGSDPLPKNITPAEYAFGLDLYVGGRLEPVSNGALVRPDSINQAIGQKLEAWLQELQDRPVKGLQLDPYGQLYVGMGQDAVAIQQFEERLTTPGLSEADKAYTLTLAVKLFANPSNPTRMETARGYLKRLEALSDQFITNKYGAQSAFAQAFRVAGATDSAITHAKTAFALAPRIPFERRGPTLFRGLFMTFADAVAGKANGRQQIDSIGQYLMTFTNPTAEQIAKDSAYFWMGRGYQRSMRNDIRLASHLGKKAPPLIATHWFNTSAPSMASDAAPTAKQLPLNDGKIRLFEYGELGCAPCQAALPGMDRIRKSAPAGVEVWYVTNTAGSWGAATRTPDEEAQNLKHYYTERKGFGMPIALWAGPKDSTIDGGFRPRESPSFKAFPIQGTPTFIITDGNGVVRHIAIGYSSRMENMMASQIQYLVAEANHESVDEVKKPQTKRATTLDRNEEQSTTERN